MNGGIASSVRIDLRPISEGGVRARDAPRTGAAVPIEANEDDVAVSLRRVKGREGNERVRPDSDVSDRGRSVHRVINIHCTKSKDKPAEQFIVVRGLGEGVVARGGGGDLPEQGHPHVVGRDRAVGICLIDFRPTSSGGRADGVAQALGKHSRDEKVAHSTGRLSNSLRVGRGVPGASACQDIGDCH